MARKKYTIEQIIVKLREVEVLSGQDHRRGCASSRDPRTDVLSMAERIRRDEQRRGKADEAVGEGKRPAEEVGGGTGVGYRHIERRELKNF